MTGPSFDALVYAWIGIALLSFVALLRVRAPYGRYTTATWGPTVPHRRGWILMEVVSPAAFLLGDGAAYISGQAITVDGAASVKLSPATCTPAPSSVSASSG